MKKSISKFIKSLLLVSLVICLYNTSGSSQTKLTKTNTNAERQALEVWKNKIEWQQKREPDDYRKFIAHFKDVFNSDDMTKILDHTSELMLKETPAEKVVGFLNFFKNDHGKIKSMRFKYFDKRNQRRDAEELAVYFLEFENGTQWEFRVGVNESLKMTRYVITDNNYNEDLPLVKSRTRLSLPFEKGEEWFVLWGGETQEDNYHVVSRSQKNAFDFVIRHPWNNKSYKTDGKTNEDYYAFGKPVYSPANGTIVKVIDGVNDNEIGKMNPKQLTGNTVIIRSQNGEYILLAHFKDNTIKVKENDKVKIGDLLGLCGTSGNSSEPHLHMQVMDKPEMKDATGLKIYFDSVVLNGESPTINYSPVRGNSVKRK